MATIRRYAAFTGTIRRLVERLVPARIVAKVTAVAAVAVEHWHNAAAALTSKASASVQAETQHVSATAAQSTASAAIGTETQHAVTPAATTRAALSLAAEARHTVAPAARVKASGSAVLARQSEVLMAGGAVGERETMSDGTPVLAFQT